MNVDVPDALAVQGMTFDEVQHLDALGHHRRGQILQQPEDRLAVAQAPARDLLHHERMHHDGRTRQQVD